MNVEQWSITNFLQVCQNITKKISESVSTKGSDGPAVEKRIRKTPEFSLGQTFQVLFYENLSLQISQTINIAVILKRVL